MSQLEHEYQDHARMERVREAAIWKYALAVRYHEMGDANAADKAAKECLDLVSELPDSQLEDVTHQYIEVGGVAIPEYFHEGSVKNRFAHFGLAKAKE